MSEIKSSSSSSNTISDSVIKADLPPRGLRRKARKELAYFEPLEEPGTLYNAEVHGSAQRLLKIHRITKYVKFCRCCSLPQETPGVVVPFNWFDDQLDFGIGIYLYFYYIKFCLVMAIICIGLSSISTIVFSEDYADDIRDYCLSQVNSTLVNSTLRFLEYTYKDLQKDCLKYIDYDNYTDTDDTFKADWLSDMSSYNLKSYYDVFAYKARDDQKDNIDDVLLDFSFMYFLTGISVLLANYLFIQIVSLLSQYENYKYTTPADYAVLIHGVPKPVDENGKMKDEVMKIVNEVNQYINPLVVHQIIPCLRIGEIYDIAKKKYKEETKLYHVEHFERQIKLNKSNNFSKENGNLHYFKNQLGIVDTKTPIKEIEKKVEEYNNKLIEMNNELNENPNKFNGGTFFLIFDNIIMKDKFVEFYPRTYFNKIMWSLRYFLENIILGGCISEERRRLNTLKLGLDVSSGIEPYEVEWENMGYTRTERNIRFIISIVSCIVLIIIALGILIGLNRLQRYVAEKQKDFWKYFISFFISIIIAVTNFVGKLLFKKLTNLEKIEVKTNFYISYSIKLTIFTFVTIAILPLVSNIIFGLNGSDILINNLLMIFITNILLPPLLFYFGPDFAIKLYKRTKVRLDLKNVKYEKSIYTQGELNEIFENPEMDICFKYSYITNIFLISLFYMSIFPIGMIFGFVALLFAYISEFFYIGLYKRPEILNSRLCRFYVSNFKWAIFIFSLGNYIFLSPLNENQRTNWSLINLIVFLVICLIPYQSIKIIKINFSEGENKFESYNSNYIFFSTDYEKLNPFTRKRAYTKYFQKLLDDRIIDPTEGKRIISKINNTNEISSYLKTRRHIDLYSASQESNNLYLKNKNEPKIQYMFGESDENKKSFSLGGLKNLIMETNEFKEDKMDSKDLDEIRNMKAILYEFSTTNTGICNALIFLDEKNNINDEFENYNFNPWKAEWLYTPEYKKKRKDMIHQIRSSMDFRGEISDDEDSIIKYDDKRDYINEKIRQMNEQILKKRQSVYVSTSEKKNKNERPLIYNSQLLSGEVRNSKLKVSRNSIVTQSSGRKHSDSNQKLHIRESFSKNNNLNNSYNNINSVNNMTQQSLMGDPKLFPQDTNPNMINYNHNKK